MWEKQNVQAGKLNKLLGFLVSFQFQLKYVCKQLKKKKKE